MMLESALQENFQWYKAGGITASLLLILLFQLLFPNRLALRDLLRNWKVNAPVAVINVFLLSLLCGACVCTWAVTVRQQGIGFFAMESFPLWVEVLLTVLLLDGVAWAWHLANHHNSFLWRFHAVHHSDTHFDASTAFRFHPGELLISLSVRLVVVTLTALPILGLILFEVIYGFFNLFVHSDIKLPTRWERRLSQLFVTPSLHRVHHSMERTDHNLNFGTILSAWDRISRTFRWADAETPVTVGLPASDGNPDSLRRALLLPFGKRPRAESKTASSKPL